MVTPANPTIPDEVRRAYDAGLCPIPPRSDGSKAPAVPEWKSFQAQRPSLAEVLQLFGTSTGIGVICGAVSGGLEMLEIEGRAVREGIFDEFRDRADEWGLGHLLARLCIGYWERTPSRGAHWLYRCPTIGPNTRLAQRPATAEELAEHAGQRTAVLIETRGEGGYVITAPSYGPVHPTGLAWEIVAGNFATIPTITAEEREALFALARSFDQMPPIPVEAPRRRRAPPDEGLKPGDDFNARVSWTDVLEPHGWVRVKATGGETYWRRPGKDTKGHSATTNYGGSDLLLVFSTSTPFEVGRSYDKFAAVTFLEHGGDFAACARSLYARGFGDRHERHGGHQWREVSNSEPERNPNDPGPKEPPTVSEQPHDSPQGHDPEDDEGDGPDLPPVLPDAFWEARPELAVIRQAAQHRLISPDALLGACLARTILLTDYRFTIPPYVGRRSSLNIFVGIVGVSGAGKGSAFDEARRLLPAAMADDYRVGEITAGSGEGMIGAFYQERSVPNETGKGHHTEYVQAQEGILVRIDEGRILKELAARSGQVTIPMLLSAYFGETLGNTYRSRAERPEGPQLPLGGGDGYPARDGRYLFSIEEIASGLPQRFVWFSTWDPDAPRPEDSPPEPGRLAWKPPKITDPGIGPAIEIEGIGRRWSVIADEEIVRQIRLAQWEKVTGERADPIEGHAEAVATQDGDRPGHPQRAHRRDDAGLGAGQGWSWRRLTGYVAGCWPALPWWSRRKRRRPTNGLSSGSVEKPLRATLPLEKVRRVAEVLTRAVQRHNGDDGLRAGT